MPPATRSRMPDLHDEVIVAVSLRLVSPNGMSGGIAGRLGGIDVVRCRSVW